METATNAHSLASAPRSPRKASSVLLAGLACLALLLLGGLYFISTLQPAVHVSSTVESTAIPSANPDTSTISPFPRLDNLAGHAMFAPLIAPASDSFPKVRVRQR